MRNSVKLVVVASIAVLVAVAAFGTEFQVTNTVELISSLRAAADNGEDDVLVLEAGTYQGNFTYNPRDGKATTIQGAEGTTPSEVILDGGGRRSVLVLIASSQGGSVTIEGLTVQNGKAKKDYGGGIKVTGAAGTLELYLKSVIVQYNSADYRGGGIGIRPSEDFSVKVEIWDSIIQYNETPGFADGRQGRGGGIYANAHNGKSSIDLLVVNTLVYGNKANWTGGGINLDASEVGEGNTVHAVLINTTVTGNVADMNDRGYHPGGGIRVYGYTGKGSQTTLELYNCIVWGNTVIGNEPGQDLYIDARDPGDAGLHVDHCDIGDVHVGGRVSSQYEDVQLISSDPLFIDQDAGDFRLREGSPCIDAGISDLPDLGLPEFDIDGGSRLCGVAPDLGPYERCGD